MHVDVWIIASYYICYEVAIGPVTGRDSHSYRGPALNDFQRLGEGCIGN